MRHPSLFAYGPVPPGGRGLGRVPAISIPPRCRGGEHRSVRRWRSNA